jgi:hypothetical protein
MLASLTIPLAQTATDPPVSTALLEAFIAIGGAVATYSSLLAFLSLERGEPPEKWAEAATYGVASGFPVGAIVGIALFLDSAIGL